MVAAVAAMVAVAVAGIAAAIDGDFTVAVLALAVAVLANAHLSLHRDVVRLVEQKSRLIYRQSATIASWVQTLARRAGHLKHDGWVCPECLQANVGWDDECGRCGYADDDTPIEGTRAG